MNALNELRTHRKVPLAWVVGYGGCEGNGKADTLAPAGASMAMTIPQPFCGVAEACTKMSIKLWIQAKWLDLYNESP